MLGQILNELAQVERWLFGNIRGHEDHRPENCVWAEFHTLTKDYAGETTQELAGTVVFSMLMLLRKTQNPAKAGLAIVDKVRGLCAAMARDRIAMKRDAATSNVHDWSQMVRDTYNTPN